MGEGEAEAVSVTVADCVVDKENVDEASSEEVGDTDGVAVTLRERDGSLDGVVVSVALGASMEDVPEGERDSDDVADAVVLNEMSFVDDTVRVGVALCDVDTDRVRLRDDVNVDDGVGVGGGVMVDVRVADWLLVNDEDRVTERESVRLRDKVAASVALSYVPVWLGVSEPDAESGSLEGDLLKDIVRDVLSLSDVEGDTLASSVREPTVPE